MGMRGIARFRGAIAREITCDRCAVATDTCLRATHVCYVLVDAACDVLLRCVAVQRCPSPPAGSRCCELWPSRAASAVTKRLGPMQLAPARAASRISTDPSALRHSSIAASSVRLAELDSVRSHIALRTQRADALWNHTTGETADHALGSATVTSLPSAWTTSPQSTTRQSWR